MCSCGHAANQHSRNGCTWADPDGRNACRCKVKYTDLITRPEPRKKR
jgi:hypothetical protein